MINQSPSKGETRKQMNIANEIHFLPLYSKNISKVLTLPLGMFHIITNWTEEKTLGTKGKWPKEIKQFQREEKTRNHYINHLIYTGRVWFASPPAFPHAHLFFIKTKKGDHRTMCGEFIVILISIIFSGWLDAFTGTKTYSLFSITIDLHYAIWCPLTTVASEL